MSRYNPITKKLYYEKNKETILINMKKAYETKDREKMILNARKNHLRKKYFPHMTGDEALAEYQRMFDAQKGLCAICSKPEVKVDKQRNKPIVLAVDHDHSTGRIRGLLCFICNTNLGRFENFLPKVLNYIGIAA